MKVVLVDGAMVDALPRCRGLIRYGVGHDVPDVGAATERGILPFLEPLIIVLLLVMYIAPLSMWLHDLVLGK